jgi:hypothetical protein
MEEKLRANLGPTRGQPKTDQRQIKDKTKTEQGRKKTRAVKEDGLQPI